MRLAALKAFLASMIYMSRNGSSNERDLIAWIMVSVPFLSSLP